MKSCYKVLLLLLAAVMVFALGGCTEPSSETTTAAPDVTDGRIDWTLHGTWLTADGEVQGNMDFSLKGSFPQEYELRGQAELELDFIWPDTFRFQNEGLTSYTSSGNIADRHNNQALFHGTGWVLDPATNDMASLSFTICPEEGFAVIRFGNESRYLVASTDPNADPAEIFAFYDEYVYTENG